MCCITTTTIKIGNISITTKRLTSFRIDESALLKKLLCQRMLEKHSNLNSFPHFNTKRRYYEKNNS